jgi:RimJ/RimL family protein N-acetyltransferase
MNINGKKVTLRAMEPEDMEMLRETVNDPEIERMVGGWSFPISTYQQMKWYESVINDKNNLRFIIEDKETHKAIGAINLINIDWKNRNAFTGMKLHSTAPHGKGYATDSIMALMCYVFEQLQFERLDGSWLLYNLPSKRVYEKCGWRVEGIKRRAVFKDGQYHDQAYAGVLKEDYFEAKKRLGWNPS